MLLTLTRTAFAWALCAMISIKQRMLCAPAPWLLEKVLELGTTAVMNRCPAKMDVRRLCRIEIIVVEERRENKGSENLNQQKQKKEEKRKEKKRNP